ncbi:MAG: hypothetical protein COW84_04395 [Gammaproteobacteria bacterium CG22_combo_CG10-13_8_21_14_all_40_8]|nr:MAG: hypothetical protein COW84_04395 [Gammaproteobacteria bacterium CG22_combo_CG10-13_8_21_14_all_40_8]
MKHWCFFKNLFNLCLALFLTFCLSSCQLLTSQYHSNSLHQQQSIQYFTPEDLKQDEQFLLSSLSNVGIDPWKTLSQAQFESELANIEKNTFWLQSRLDFYRRLAPLVASLKETHTRLIYPQSLRKQDGQNKPHFPLQLRLEDDHVYIEQDFSNKRLIPSGAEIYSINHVDIQQILTSMMKFIAAETITGAKRQAEFSFATLLSTELGFQEPYLIDWSLGYLHTQTTLPTTQHLYATNTSPIKASANLEVRMINSETRLLKIHHFETKADLFDQQLDNFFEELNQQQVNNLILDLRYNGGGIGDNVLHLLSHLEAEPIHWAKNIQLKNSDTFRHYNAKRLKQLKKQKFGKPLSWLPIEYLNGWNWQLLFADNGDLITQHIDPEPLAREETQFSGKILVLTNGYCFSGCAFFVNEIQTRHRGLLIGEQPGSLGGIQYGYPITVTLPNTHLQLMIPVAKIIQADKSHQIMPDIPIKTSAVALAQGIDSYLSAALKYLSMQSL